MLSVFHERLNLYNFLASCNLKRKKQMSNLLQIIRAGEVPPPSTVGSSCVYILRRVDGRFYCGETDSLKDRLNTHRKKRGWSHTEAAYMVLPSGAQGKSTAIALEAQTIQVWVPGSLDFC